MSSELNLALTVLAWMGVVYLVVHTAYSVYGLLLAQRSRKQLEKAVDDLNKLSLSGMTQAADPSKLWTN